jgi:hypothetical protein
LDSRPIAWPRSLQKKLSSRTPKEQGTSAKRIAQRSLRASIGPICAE